MDVAESFKLPILFPFAVYTAAVPCKNIPVIPEAPVTRILLTTLLFTSEPAPEPELTEIGTI